MTDFECPVCRQGVSKLYAEVLPPQPDGSACPIACAVCIFISTGSGRPLMATAVYSRGTRAGSIDRSHPNSEVLTH